MESADGEINGSQIEESSDEENSVEDGDTCDPQELETVFANEFRLTDERAVSAKKRYLLYLTNSNDFKTICTSSHTNEVYVLNLSNTGLDSTTIKPYFSKERNDICGLKFFNSCANCLLTGTTDGFINLYDLRTSKKIFSLEDSSEKARKPITCFDINSNDRVLCAGSDLIEAEAFLIYFDIRQRKLLGSYYDSHSDNITTVKFHPENPDLMGSGSTDGLINIFNISDKTEDDALKYCFNSSNSIANINWHPKKSGKYYISCITDTNDFQIYDVKKQNLISEFSRVTIAEKMKRKSAIDCNLVNCHNIYKNTICLLATSNYNKGECLRSLKFEENQLKPLGNFAQNKQIIRNSIYSMRYQTFITCGEAGVLSVWKTDNAPPISKSYPKKRTYDKINLK